MFEIILFLLVVSVVSINLDSFEDLLMDQQEGMNSKLVFHHESYVPEERDGVLFYPASTELSDYLAITTEDPYALVNISGGQFNTYSYQDGVTELKYFDQTEGVHPQLLLNQTDLNTFVPSGVHVFLIFSNVSESKEYANIVNTLPHNNVTKHCFDLSESSYGMDFKHVPAIGVFSPLWTQLIEIQEPVSSEFVSQVLDDTFDLMNMDWSVE
jgi:hypothetical protein